MPLNQELAKYYQKLLKLAEKITKGNKVDAQDLVQDLYVIILEYDQEKIKHGTKRHNNCNNCNSINCNCRII